MTREEAIFELIKLRRKLEKDSTIDVMPFDMAIEALKSSTWIPCSERLPKPSEHTDDMVLVCTSNGAIRFGACWYNRGICEGWVGDLPVVAWMPLPEPWKGE